MQTLTGVLGIDLTILRAGWAVTYQVLIHLKYNWIINVIDDHLVDGNVEITENNTSHDGDPEFVRISPPLIRQPDHMRILIINY